MAGLFRQIYNAVLPLETRSLIHKLRHPHEYEELRKGVYKSHNGDFSLKPFDEHRCIFIHITKTAGTSVAQSLFSHMPYHYTATEYRIIYGKRIFNEYFKFAFVRNPWDRLYSAYRYLKSGGWNDDDRQWAEENLAGYNDFNVFVKEWLTLENTHKHIHFKPQYQFICDRKGNLMVDYLAYFETIENDFAEIRKRLNINKVIAHHNANPGASYRDVYNTESRTIVADVYSKDICLFGYNFDGIKNRLAVN